MKLMYEGIQGYFFIPFCERILVLSRNCMSSSVFSLGRKPIIRPRFEHKNS